MQYLLTDDEYSQMKLAATFGPSNNLCEHCKHASDPVSMAIACPHLYGFADVSRATGVMFVITRCKDFARKE